MLQSLEQLTNSQTAGGAIRTVFTLRIFGLYTLCNIVLWSFNPLGSQASLRGIYIKERTSDGTRNLTIVFSFPLSRASDLELGLDSNAAAIMVYATAFASIDSSTQYVDRNSENYLNLIARLEARKVF